MNAHNVSVAAEAFAAAQFARLGFDVSVQYGANQPENDLIVAREDLLLKISVKGSQDGSWGLTQSYMGKGKKADYHGAKGKFAKSIEVAVAILVLLDVILLLRGK